MQQHLYQRYLSKKFRGLRYKLLSKYGLGREKVGARENRRILSGTLFILVDTGPKAILRAMRM